MGRPPPNGEQPQSRDERIAERVRAIPEGFVRTYGDIDPRAPRRVGLVLSRTHGIPWHRVVRADGKPAKGGSATAAVASRRSADARRARRSRPGAVATGALGVPRTAL